jgi:CHAT domain-containing protein
MVQILLQPRRAQVSPRPHTVASPARSSQLQQALRDVRISRDGLSVPRLLSSRQEAEAIIEAAAGAGMRATDFKASLATATSPELGQYRIVHFATHGLLNSEHPELSGLVLSLVDEQGKPQNGFLGLHDIYNLNWPVDLVVLSACNTALGKEVRGEGLVGIVRGFMYAGAARVIASLWKVDDEATAELMKRFYQRMLQGGMSPAAALRAAQVDMWQQKRWHSPYFWAAFQLQGEYK